MRSRVVPAEPVRVEVRAERPGEAAAVRVVVTRSFGGDHGAVVADLVDSLRESPAWQGLSFVAELGGELIGHVLFTRSLLDAPRRLLGVQVLSPLAVVPDHQRRGVGGALVGHGLGVLAARGDPLVFLEGAPRYYARFGFVRASAHGFRSPSLRIPEAAFQVRMLPAYETWMTGTLVYAEPFWRHDCVGLREPGAG